MPHEPLRIKLLGAPVVTWQEQDIAITRRQARALLFHLAVTMQPVSRDALLLLLWPDADEVTARRNLTRLLSALRSALPRPDILLSTPAAVSLNPELVWSDAAAFTMLVDEADRAQWEAAVSLVRGPFLDGFALHDSAEFDSWQSRRQYDIERRYLALLADLVRDSRGRGQMQTAVHYATQYLATDNLAEEMHRHLIELYAQSGDRAAALRQYEACVAVLEQELGVPPLPETRAAYEAARDGVPVTVPEVITEPQWAVLPSLDLPLLGREEEMAALGAAYDRLQGGGVIFLSGEPGVGKTRLMQAFVMRRVALVLTGASNDEMAGLPYQPLVQALRQSLPLLSRWRQIAPIWLAEVARLLPELRALFPELPAALEVEPEQAQARLFEALRQAFLGLAGGASLLLCLDDVQWADRATQGWLHYMTRRLAGGGICILATYRSTQPGAVVDWQRGLQRANLMAEVALGGLGETAVGELLGQLPQQPPDHASLAARIFANTGGNAFFVLETIRELMSGGGLAEASARLPLPQTVRDAVLRRAARVSPLAQQVLEVAAVLAPQATLETIGGTVGRDGLETAVSLEELVAQQLLRPEGDRFQFRHALAREAIYEAISPWRRRLLHGRAASTLAVLEPGNEGAIAAHLEAAGEAEQAAGYYVRAARSAGHLYANHAALDYYEKALALSGGENAAAQLVIYDGLGRVLRRQAQYDRAEAAFQLMQAAATRTEDVEMIARSWLRLGGVQDSQRRYEASLKSAEKAHAIAVQNELDLVRISAQYAQAWALFRLGRLDEALPIAGQTLEQSRSLDHQAMIARSHNTLGAIYKYLGEYELSVEHQRAALALFERLGDRRRVAGVLSNLGETARLQDDLRLAHDLFTEAVEVAEAIGERDWMVEFLNNLAGVQRGLGHHEEAAATFSKAEAYAKRPGSFPT